MCGYEKNKSTKVEVICTKSIKEIVLKQIYNVNIFQSLSGLIMGFKHKSTVLKRFRG